MAEPDWEPVGTALARLWRSTRSLEPVNRGLRATLGARPWRGLVPGPIWRRIPAVGSFHVEVPGTRGFTYCGRGEPVGKTLFWRGIDAFEPGTAAVFIALARQCRQFADIGAYSGYYTLLGLTTNSELTAHCFEPVPALRAWLVMHLEANGFLPRARVVAAALSDRSDDEQAFYVPLRANAPGSSLVASASPNRRPVSVPVLSLDDYRRKANVTLDLIKIDTEGAEDAVLKGATDVLETDRPYVVCEILNSEADHLARVEHALRERHYAYGLITAEGTVRETHLRPDPRRVLRNFLLWPEERALPTLPSGGPPKAAAS